MFNELAVTMCANMPSVGMFTHVSQKRGHVVVEEFI